jgi:predicted acylesterase/phospholipase RssA
MVSGMPPVRLQLALQGGGARLYALLATLEVVQELQRNDKIKVTRVAGTSAGALAAALFAADVDMSKLRQRIIDNRTRLERLVPSPTYFLGARCFFTGRPMVDMEPLRKVLNEIFKDKQVQSFDELPTPLYVLATNLTNSSTHVHSGQDNVVTAVLNSCAIPFYFRGPGQKSGPDLLVDGGICENFPVDVLRPHEDKDGPVVGVSFRPNPTPGTPYSTAGFAMALLNAAMDNSVRRAQRQLGNKFLFSIETDIGTFDFPAALGRGMGDAYKIVRYQAEDFFHNISDAAKPVRAGTKPKPTVVVEADQHDLDSDTTLQAHADLYEAQHAGVMMNYQEALMIGRINSLADDSQPDSLLYRLRFGAANSPLECIRIVVVEEKQFTFLRTLRTEVTDRNYRTRPTIDLRARSKKSPDSRSYLLFFNPTIQPNDADGPFTLEYSHSVGGLFEPLKKNGVDTMSVETNRTDKITPKVTLLAILPNTHPGYSMRESADTTSTDKGRLLSPAEVKQAAQELALGGEHYVIGWIGADIEPNREFAAEIFAPAQARSS